VDAERSLVAGVVIVISCCVVGVGVGIVIDSSMVQ
jgi:hypothetical protein